MKQWELAGVTVSREGAVEERHERPSGSVRVVVDQIPGMVWTTDTALRLTSLSGEGLRSLRLGPNQIVGWTLLEFVGTSDWPMILAHRQALLGRVGSFPFDWGRRRFLARVGPLRSSSGEVVGAVCVAIELEPERGQEEASELRGHLPIEGNLVLP